MANNYAVRETVLLRAFFQIRLIGFAQKHCVHYLYLIFFNNTKQYDLAKQIGAACDVDCVSIVLVGFIVAIFLVEYIDIVWWCIDSSILFR